jgi:hypothetical protein
MSAARNRSAERSAGTVVRHDRNASRAAATAASMSAAPDSVATSWPVPVAGSISSR